MIEIKLRDKAKIITATDWCVRAKESGLITGVVKVTNWREIERLFQPDYEICFQFEKEIDALRFKFEGF